MLDSKEFGYEFGPLAKCTKFLSKFLKKFRSDVPRATEISPSVT